MSSKICGIVIFYNPTSQHIESLKTNLDVLDGMIVVVNGEWDDRFHELSDRKNIEFIIEGSNLGIAKATNDGILKAKLYNAYTHVCLLDQDTNLPKNYRDILLLWDDLNPKNKVGIIAPTYKNPRTNIAAKALIFNKYTFNRFQPSNHIERVSCPIASGSLLSLEIFDQVGLLREDLFIDYVDNEFSLRLLSKGYVNYMTSSICMLHELGEQKIFRFLGLEIRPTNHSPIRKYYISRNRMEVIKCYGSKTPSIITFELIAIFYDLFRVIAFETKKLEKIQLSFLGFLDFSRRRFGKINDWR